MRASLQVRFANHAWGQTTDPRRPGSIDSRRLAPAMVQYWNVCSPLGTPRRMEAQVKAAAVRVRPGMTTDRNTKNAKQKSRQVRTGLLPKKVKMRNKYSRNAVVTPGVPRSSYVGSQEPYRLRDRETLRRQRSLQCKRQAGNHQVDTTLPDQQAADSPGQAHHDMSCPSQSQARSPSRPRSTQLSPRCSCPEETDRKCSVC